MYFAVAVIAAAAVFLAAEWVREPGTRAPDHPGRTALAAGLLWPIVLVGLGQCALMVAAHNRWAGKPALVPRIGVVTGTGPL